MAYVKGAVAASAFLIVFIAWALKDQLEMSRQLPVLMEQKESRIRNLEEKQKAIENYLQQQKSGTGKPALMGGGNV